MTRTASMLSVGLLAYALLSQAALALDPDARASLSSAAAHHHCTDMIAAARSVLATAPDDLPALQAIAFCTAGATADSDFTGTAREMFQDSKVLSLVPELLEFAQVKDLVPVLREVETKKTKSVADYLMMHQIYERMGNPKAQIRALELASTVDPQDPRPKLLLASRKLALGDTGGARRLYREYLASPQADHTQVYLLVYLAALAWPWPTLAGLTALFMGLWGAMLLRLRKKWAFVEALTTGPTTWATWGVPALIPVGLGAQFSGTGNAMALSVLVLCESALLVGLLAPLATPLFVATGHGLRALFGVRLARAMAIIPPGWRVLIALAAIIAMGTVVPVIAIPDVRYAAMTVCGLLFFGTVGSLLVSFLRASSSLRDSLRWIGIAATLPFLVVFLISNWTEIGEPMLRLHPPSARAVASLYNYLIMWGLCVFLAIHLSKILADSLVSPVREMMWKVTAIEKGDFAARVNVMSLDEIGSLARAVNNMAAGLARREYVEKTFRRYVDKRVADHILEGDEATVHIKGQRLHGVVMFCDIRGFTTLSEDMEPEAIITMLNEFFERMVKVITSHGGIIDKFIGDNIMAVWGVPKPTDHMEWSAVEAAIEMMAELKNLNGDFAGASRPEVGMGIGINAGTLVAGSLGSRDRMEYTVIGDTVNTAQRAESAAQPGQILITDSVREALGEDLIVEGFEDRRVKGKSLPVRLWVAKELGVRHQKAG